MVIYFVPKIHKAGGFQNFINQYNSKREQGIVTLLKEYHINTQDKLLTFMNHYEYKKNYFFTFQNVFNLVIMIIQVIFLISVNHEVNLDYVFVIVIICFLVLIIYSVRLFLSIIIPTSLSVQKDIFETLSLIYYNYENYQERLR